MATVSYLGKSKDDTNRTTYTFSGVGFGEADSDRRIILLIEGRDDAPSNISSVTIGGVAATVTSLGEPSGFSSSEDISVACASVPTGTTGDVVVTHNSQRSGCTIWRYRALGISSNTPVDTATDEDVASLTATIDTPREGVCFGFALANTDYTPGVTWSWSGLTLDDDGAATEGYEYTIAHKVFTETAIGTTIGLSCSPSEDIWFALVSFPAYTAFTNPGNVYASDDSYATCAATSGDLTLDLSLDGGNTYGTELTKTYTGTEGAQTYGTGSTELWGLSPTRADMVDANFKLRVTHGAYSQVFGGFGFTTGTETLTGIEVSVEAKYASDTISIDHIQVKIYYGTSTLPIQAGSMAFASDGRKAGEGVGSGTGVLVFHDGTSWIASDTGATVAA